MKMKLLENPLCEEQLVDEERSDSLLSAFKPMVESSFAY
jgi:hypothetical protein